MLNFTLLNTNNIYNFFQNSNIISNVSHQTSLPPRIRYCSQGLQEPMYVCCEEVCPDMWVGVIAIWSVGKLDMAVSWVIATRKQKHFELDIMF